MPDEIRDGIQQLRSGIAARDPDVVEDAIEQLDFFIMEDGSWREPIVDGLKALLRDRRFLAIPTAARLARLVAENWDELTPEQRIQIRPLLSDAFGYFGDSMGEFVLAEIHGERYADEEAFATLDRLSVEAATTPARALATYGLGRLAKTLGSGHLYSRVIEGCRLSPTARRPTSGMRHAARS